MFKKILKFISNPGIASLLTAILFSIGWLIESTILKDKIKNLVNYGINTWCNNREIIFYIFPRELLLLTSITLGILLLIAWMRAHKLRNQINEQSEKLQQPKIKLKPYYGVLWNVDPSNFPLSQHELPYCTCHEKQMIHWGGNTNKGQQSFVKCAINPEAHGFGLQNTKGEPTTVNEAIENINKELGCSE